MSDYWKAPAAEWFRKLAAVMRDAPADFPVRLETLRNATWAASLLERSIREMDQSKSRSGTCPENCAQNGYPVRDCPVHGAQPRGEP